MRRVATLCALIICLVALAVSTPALAAARDTTTAARGRTLFGVSAVGSGRDSVPAGVAQAFAFKTARTGTVKSVIVYIGAGTGSKRLEAGLYGSRRGQPATLMTSGSLSSVSSGRWAKISVRPSSVTAGTTYWLAFLSPRGPLVLRDHATSSCGRTSVRQPSLRSLPPSWSSRRGGPTCSVSAYASGQPSAGAARVTDPSGSGQATLVTNPAPGATGSAPSGTGESPTLPSLLPPINLAAPTVSGSPAAGQTLTTTDGNWLTSPMSFAYAWQDCDSSGASCATVSGATASVYTLGSGDVGHTVRAVVTAKNASGATPASSSPTSVVSSGSSGLGSGGSGSGGSGSITCNLNAATSNFSSQVSAASGGQTICLASGNYGTWSGTNKAITIAAASGASRRW